MKGEAGDFPGLAPPAWGIPVSRLLCLICVYVLGKRCGLDVIAVPRTGGIDWFEIELPPVHLSQGYPEGFWLVKTSPLHLQSGVICRSLTGRRGAWLGIH